MSLSTESTEDQPARAADAGAPLLTGTAGNRCTNCHATLAIDQRYCVECGTRRGNPRFTLAPAAPAPGVATRSVTAIGSAAVTRLQLLLALVVVLIALGVGVLIGHGSAKAPRVTVSGAGVARSSSSKAAGGAPTTKPSGGSSSSAGGNLFNSGS